MRLDPDAFNKFLANVGQRFSFRQAYACPCIDPETNAPQTDCAQCSGFGWSWGTPVTGVSGIASLKVQREWANFGLWQSGDVVLSIPSDSPIYGIGPFDRVTMLDSTEAFSFVRRRGFDDTQPVAWHKISRVYWLDDGEVVEGRLPDVASGTLQWGSGGPPNGQQYSITGRKHPEYYMLQEFAQDRAHHQGLALPRRVVLRKLDLLARA